MDIWVLQRANLVKHLVGDLGIQVHFAVLELVEWRVESAVDVQELIVEALQAVSMLLFDRTDLRLDFLKVSLSSLNVLLGLHEEELLLLVMSLSLVCQRLNPALEHFDHKILLLFQLVESVLHVGLELILYLLNVVVKHISLGKGGFNLLLEHVLLLCDGIHLDNIFIL